MALGCGKTPCEKVTDYLVEECKIVTAADDTVEECGKDSIAACEAECTLAADCTLFVPPSAMTGDAFSAFLQAQDDYDNCKKACQPPEPVEPDDTAVVF